MAKDHEHLEQLILCGSLEEVFALVTLEEIAEAWCRYQLRPHPHGAEDDDPDWWAVQLVMDADFWSGEARIRSVITLLVERADGDEVLGVVGAGPLEDFVKRYNDDRLAWIERSAAESPRFRQALRNVWIWRAAPPDVFARVERAAGAPLADPDRERATGDSSHGAPP